MNDEDRSEEIRRLEQLVAGETGALAFPLLAEAWRRDGHPEDAERVARRGLELSPHATAGRVALALALLDQKRPDEARAELERLLGGDPEHHIAQDAVVGEEPEGLAPVQASHAVQPESLATNAPAAGELANLDPYPFTPLPEAVDPAPGPPTLERGPVPVEGASVPLEDASVPVSLEPVDVGRFGPPPPPAPAEPLVFDSHEVGDDELDTAFDEAESDRDQMLGADDVAQAALATVPDEEDGDAELDPAPRADVAEGEDEFGAVTTGPQSPFATETVAGLLESQGHPDEADRLREQMESSSAQATDEASAEHDEPPPAPGAPAKQATLERWLDNLRRDKP